MRTAKTLLLSAAGLAALVAAPAFAADMPVKYVAPVVEAPWTGGWQVRVRAVAVIPDAKVDINIGAPVNASLGDIGKISTTVIPEIDLSYYFTPNWAVELILGVTPHKVTGQNQLAGLEIGQTWLLPPTLTLQYHFTNFGAFQPYIGGGVNYTVFFNTSGANITTNTPALAGIAVTSLGLKNTWAPAAQIGFDYMLNKHVGLNFDVKKLWLRPNWDGAVNNAIPINGKAQIDPWLIGGGVTYRF